MRYPVEKGRKVCFFINHLRNPQNKIPSLHVHRDWTIITLYEICVISNALLGFGDVKLQNYALHPFQKPCIRRLIHLKTIRQIFSSVAHHVGRA